MERPALAETRTGCLQAPEAHLPSFTARRNKDRSSTATFVDNIPIRQASRRQESHPRQPRKEDRRSGWGEEPHTTPTSATRGNPFSGDKGRAGPSSLDSETGQDGAATPWHSNDGESSRTNTCAAGVRTRMGGSF